MKKNQTEKYDGIIVGAGLCGTLAAIRLAQRGLKIALLEKRADMRHVTVDGGRSINLAISDRGFRALRMAGMEEEIRSQVIPMRGRMIHSIDGETWFSPYSGRKSEYINSVSRSGLNSTLLDHTGKYEDIDLYFNTRCTKVDLETATVHCSDLKTGENTTYSADFIIGADGAGSAVRMSMLERSASLRFDFSQDFLDHGYKELSIPPAKDGGWRLEKGALHIWPRQDYMLIALPNLDGSFTVTLFLSYDGAPGFHKLRTEKDVDRFFSSVFPTAYAQMPDLTTDYFRNPTSTLGTIKCYPWQAFGKALLIGDAAHAIVPFYGQGMNCALEDVFVLDQVIDQFGFNWDEVFGTYQKQRKKDTDAIADLALENYLEMRDHVDNPEFIKKRKLEILLEEKFPDYSSKYNLVTFNASIPYSEAMARGHKQDAFLLHYCSNNGDIRDVDIGLIYEKLKKLN